MSGPKISIYELNGQARSIVTGQIRCERECIACAKQINELLSQILSYRLQIENLAVSSDLMVSRGVEPAIRKDQLLGILNKMEQGCREIQENLSAHKPQISPKYQISNAALSEKKAELKLIRELKQQAMELRNEADATVCLGEKGQEAVSHHVEQSILEDLSGFISFGDIENESGESPEIKLDNLKRSTERKLLDLMQDVVVSPDLEAEVKQAVQSLNRIVTTENMRIFNTITVKALEKKVAEYTQKEERVKTEFTEDCSRYQVLCAMLDKKPLATQYSPEMAMFIKKEIEQMELEIVRQHEQTYISECVDQVMSEMGYDLIGTRDVKKKSGKKFHNELFTFNEGTAINVTYSSDGQIAMELGGISRVDRLPTEEETGILTKDMETFCSEFEEFERRLRAKGIIVGNRVALSPPAAEYAAIININDYDVDSEKLISEINVGEKRKAKAVEKRMLRRDE